MAELKLSDEKVKVKDSDGNTILEVGILELFYVISFAQEELQEAPTLMKMKASANAVNQEYGTNFTWKEIIQLIEYLDSELDNLKKN